MPYLISTVTAAAVSTELRLTFSDLNELARLFEGELRHRRVFVAGHHALEARQRCSVCLVHPSGEEFSIVGEAVYIQPDGPGAGVGIDLIELNPAKLRELEAFVRQHSQVQAAVESDAGSDSNPVAATLYDRIRKLSLRERDSIARQGTLTERVALERIYGGSVWEAMLQNPQLTVAEVARIAKNGMLPVPLVGVIVSNAAWLSSGEVRRALLGNPRASGAHVDRVLKAMPRSELKQLAQSCPYRGQVRTAVKRLLGE